MLCDDPFAIVLSKFGVTVIVYFCKNASLFTTPVEETNFVATIGALGNIVSLVGFVTGVVGLVVVVLFVVGLDGCVTTGCVAGFVVVVVLFVVVGFVGCVTVGAGLGCSTTGCTVGFVVVPDTVPVFVVGIVGRRGTISLCGFVAVVPDVVGFTVVTVGFLLMSASVAAIFPFVSTKATGSSVLVNR